MRTIVRRRIGAVAAAAATFLALAAPVTAAQSLQFTVGAPAPCEQATPAETEQVIADIHEYTNRERVAAGAKPVQRLESLEQIAQNWSDWAAVTGAARARKVAAAAATAPMRRLTMVRIEGIPEGLGERREYR